MSAASTLILSKPNHTSLLDHIQAEEARRGGGEGELRVKVSILLAIAPPCLVKVHWKSSGAMTGSRRLVHLRRTERRKNTLRSFGSEKKQICERHIDTHEWFCFEVTFYFNGALGFLGQHKQNFWPPFLLLTSLSSGASPDLTCVKLCRAAESVAPRRPVDGRHAHSGQGRDVGQPRRAGVGRHVEGGALATDGVLLLLLPGEPVAPSRPGIAGLPVHLHCVAAHRGQLQVCQGWSRCGRKQRI